MIRVFLSLACLVLSQTQAYAGDVERGKTVAEVRCTPCHHLHLTFKRVGPGLKHIYNRTPTISGVPYEIWDAKALDEWLANPRAVKANTKMSIQGMSERDRADVIAYLRHDASQDLAEQ